MLAKASTFLLFILPQLAMASDSGNELIDKLVSDNTDISSEFIETHRKMDIINPRPALQLVVHDIVYIVNFSKRTGHYRYYLGQNLDYLDLKILGFKLPFAKGKDQKGFFIEGRVTPGTNRVTISYRLDVSKNKTKNISLVSDRTLRGVKVFYNPKAIRVNAPTFQEFFAKYVRPGSRAIEDGYFEKGSEIKIVLTSLKPVIRQNTVMSWLKRMWLKMKIAYYDATDA